MPYRFIQLLLCFVFVTIALCKNLIAQQGPDVLQCEHLPSPLGVDNPNPRLTWQYNAMNNGFQQSAFQIFISTDPSFTVKGNTWASAIIKSSDNLFTYNSTALQPFTKYYWKVMVWGNNNATSMSSGIGSFETGMMNKTNWHGAWISDNNNDTIKPAGYYRKAFAINKKIKSARVYIATAGLFELSINGQKVGNHFLDPAYTRFDRRTLYVTFDVTQQLQAGNNAIGVLLGNGWYNMQSTAVWYFDKAIWRARPAFCLDMRITYDDGSTEVIATDKSWKTHYSPVIFNSIYTGEHYDARLEQHGWDTPVFNDSAWNNLMCRSAPAPLIISQLMYPIEKVQEIHAVKMTKLNDTCYVFDLGRNISGTTRITVDGKEGTIIKLKHGEQLTNNGHVDISNIVVHYRPTDNKDPFQTDVYILNGKGIESFSPHFNYKGFQYVEVTSSAPINLSKESLTGYFIHSNVPVAGTIHSSDSVINKIWQATNNSYLSNLMGYPTDCPQREKNGWTGDAHIASETGLYNFDGITIYEKWLADHRDEQQPNGVLPSIIPSDGWGYEWGNGPDWTSTIAIIPWNVYLFYGDKKLLADCYDNIKRYVDHIAELYPSGLTTWGLGDWVPVKSKTPVEFTSTAYYYADVTILAKAACLLGKKEDSTHYLSLANTIKKAFNAKFFAKEKGMYDKGYQTELSVALYWGLVPDSFKQTVAANLSKRMEADDYHLDVGLLGTKAILSALSDNGYANVAYKVASQRTYPSWGWWVVNGATTLLENWDIYAASDISRNHIMFGEIGAWLYKGLAGIKPDEKEPGFKHILLQPNFVDSLSSFEATYNGPYGKIISSWKHTGNMIVYDATIPPGSTATLSFSLSKDQHVYLNGKVIDSIEYNKGTMNFVYDISGGQYEFSIH